MKHCASSLHCWVPRARSRQKSASVGPVQSGYDLSVIIFDLITMFHIGHGTTWHVSIKSGSALGYGAEKDRADAGSFSHLRSP